MIFQPMDQRSAMPVCLQVYSITARLKNQDKGKKSIVAKKRNYLSLFIIHLHASSRRGYKFMNTLWKAFVKIR